MIIVYSSIAIIMIIRLTRKGWISQTEDVSFLEMGMCIWDLSKARIFSLARSQDQIFLICSIRLYVFQVLTL